MADIDVVVRRTVASATFSDVPASLSRSVTENLRPKADTVTIMFGSTGQVAFYASPDHSSPTLVTNYTAQLRAYGVNTVVGTLSLGKPTPDGNNVIIADLNPLFSGKAAGNYTVSILTTGSGGSTDSAQSAPFSLPIT